LGEKNVWLAWCSLRVEEFRILKKYNLYPYELLLLSNTAKDPPRAASCSTTAYCGSNGASLARFGEDGLGW
jgi:hypothetical protein